MVEKICIDITDWYVGYLRLSNSSLVYRVKCIDDRVYLIEEVE